MWTAHLLTDPALIVIHIEFEAEQYDHGQNTPLVVGGSAQKAPNCAMRARCARTGPRVTASKPTPRKLRLPQIFSARE